MKELLQRVENCQSMSAMNEDRRNIRIDDNSKYLDRNVRWVLFILAQYTFY
jgi:hypothetical protein